MRLAVRVPAHALFFPAASAYAALALPASVAAILGLVPSLPGLAFPAGHAHEMLFGFALAVVAGNQLGPTPARSLALLFAIWIAARAAFLVAPLGGAAALANVAFAGLLAWRIAPRLLGRAKKARNRALPIAIASLCAAAAALPIALRLGSPAAVHAVLLVAVLLLGALMLFMGGRIIAPAAAGQIHRQGGNLEARVQPRLEAALIGIMAAAVLAAAMGFAAVAGIACCAAGAVAFARLWRWRLWALRGRPDLLCLGAGYGWLALGLAAVGAALIASHHGTASLHLLTVGAMGTLTLNVMALTWARLARRDPAKLRLPVWGSACVAGATIARVGAELAPDARAWMFAAAAAWSAAFILLLASFAATRTARQPNQSGRGTPR